MRCAILGVYNFFLSSCSLTHLATSRALVFVEHLEKAHSVATFEPHLTVKQEPPDSFTTLNGPYISPRLLPPCLERFLVLERRAIRLGIFCSR